MAGLCVYVALLCGLAGAVVAERFLEYRHWPRDPNRWPPVVLRHDGVYLISANMDTQFGSSTLSQLSVHLNGATTLFTIFAVGHQNCGAMAVRLSRNSSISVTASSDTQNELHSLLTVAFVEQCAESVALRLGSESKRFKLGSHVVLDAMWGDGAWSKGHHCSYYTLLHCGLFWVMAQYRERAIREDIRVKVQSGSSTRDVLRMWTNRAKPSFHAGVVELKEGDRLFMTPSLKDATVLASTLLSLVELTARYKGNTKAAFFSGVNLKTPVKKCDKFPSTPSTDARSTGDRRPARGAQPDTSPSQRSSRAARPQLKLFFLRDIRTNEGSMASEGGSEILIPATGVYLVSMRPDSPESDPRLTFTLFKSPSAELWSVSAELGAPAGAMTAFAFKENSRLFILVTQSTSCVVEKGSYIAIALYGTN